MTMITSSPRYAGARYDGARGTVTPSSAPPQLHGIPPGADRKLTSLRRVGAS
ncbi:hypothetical protein ABZX12_19800 [Kribbella sp. NPDC003505]|uniref:hypothetical protein n=1 Tax=Kribbella sp. NPDC003505 TaxID=3154448 RepID=UPI0033B70301